MLRIIVLAVSLFCFMPVDTCDDNDIGINVEVAGRYHLRTRVERFFDRAIV